MSIIIFIIILGALIFVHELGHFLVAKWSKIRVDEFAIGFPPKLISYTRNGTKYALNLIPFGGYVKIFGESLDEESTAPEAKDSFANKSKWTQAAVLVAGVVFNVVFAWMLFTISFLSGFPTAVTEENRGTVTDPRVMVTTIAPESPADASSLAVGDVITSLRLPDDEDVTQITSVEDVQLFIATHQESEIIFGIRKPDDTTVETAITPQEGIVEEQRVVGIMMGLVGEMKLGLFKAIGYGAVTTVEKTKEVAQGLGVFFGQIFTGQANFDQVAGPVGIVGLVGDASRIGFIYLLSFTAVISLNLAVLNLIPFPALDGGRLLFILIEGITKRPIPPKVANMINAIGFIVLIGLMIIITISDVIKLF
jgi:regulator of sigma E protease